MSGPAPDDDVPWVRRAHATDAEAIGDVTVRAWRKAYRGLLPQPYLDGLDAGERTAFWRNALAMPPPDAQLLVACRGATVVGFVACGPDESSGPTRWGRVYALNVDPSAWGTGAGPALLEGAHERLVAGGFPEAVLWVLPGNGRARRFYERHGWRSDALERPAEIFGVTVIELRYRRHLP